MQATTLERKFYPEAKLLGHTFVDGTLVFYQAINELVSRNLSEKVLLDLGCGTGSYMTELHEKDLFYKINLMTFKGRARKVIGVDVDPNASINPNIDEFRLHDVNKPLPIDDSSIDVCICDWVVEHVGNVSFFFSEINRVIKKGGYVFFRTPNRLNYVYVISSLIPNGLHTKLLKKVQSFRKEEDVFPTVYRCNTKHRISKALKQNGFEPYIFLHDSEPNYLKFSYISYALGYYLHKILPTSLKSTLIAIGIKK